MSSKGKLILVSSFSGGGKTTLAGAALKHFSNLRYLTIYTTRPMRDYEARHGTFEYIFVDTKEYDRLRAANSWDHGEYAGYNYGTNASEALGLLAEGVNLVRCVSPDIATVERLESIYRINPIVIWIDTPLAVADERITHADKERSQRKQNELQNTESAELIKQRADYVFTPSEATEDSIANFTALVAQILAA